MKTESKRFIGHLAVGLAFAVLVLRMGLNPFLDVALLGYFVIMADSFLWNKAPADRILNFRVASLILVFLLVVLPTVDALEPIASPQTIDGTLRALDLRLGLDGFALSRLCAARPLLAVLMISVYIPLPLVIALAWVASRSFTLLKVCLVGALLAGLCYMLFPAAGPMRAFPDWPRAGAQVLALVPANCPRNCVPSMHFSWALMCAINVPGKSRWWFVGYAALMSLATVATGAHYFIDILVAVPYTLAIQWAVLSLSRKPAQKLLEVPCSNS